MISIIIPNWNGEKFLRDCLEGVRRQTYRNYEIFLLDNASSDSSLELVKKFFPEIQVVALAHNCGFAGAVNAGIARAKGEFVALLNNDAVPGKRWLEELVRGIQREPGIGLCASKILQVPDKKRIDAAGDAYARFGVAFQRGENRGEEEFNRPEYVFGACAAAALYRRSMLTDIGGFDEDLFFSYEDVDLSFRAQLAGFKCLYIPTAIVYHLVGGTAGTDNDFTVYYGQRNLESVFLKNMPSKLLMRYLLLHITYVFLALAYNIRKGKGKIFIRSKVDALRQISSTLQKRKIIQDKKIVSIEYLDSILDKRSIFEHIVDHF